MILQSIGTNGAKVALLVGALAFVMKPVNISPEIADEIQGGVPECNAISWTIARLYCQGDCWDYADFFITIVSEKCENIFYIVPEFGPRCSGPAYCPIGDGLGKCVDCPD